MKSSPILGLRYAAKECVFTKFEKMFYSNQVVILFVKPKKKNKITVNRRPCPEIQSNRGNVDTRLANQHLGLYSFRDASSFMFYLNQFYVSLLCSRLLFLRENEAAVFRIKLKLQFPITLQTVHHTSPSKVGAA